MAKKVVRKEVFKSTAFAESLAKLVNKNASALLKEVIFAPTCKKTGYKSVPVYQYHRIIKIYQSNAQKGWTSRDDDHFLEDAYASFYQMRGILFPPEVASKMKQPYFNYLYGTVAPKKYAAFLREFYDLCGRVQTTFTAKLLNTIDNTFPIYGHRIETLFGFSHITGSAKAKIRTSHDRLEAIIGVYEYIIEKKLLHGTGNAFDLFDVEYERFCKENDLNPIEMSEEKKIDFFLWIMGGILECHMERAKNHALWEKITSCNEYEEYMKHINDHEDFLHGTHKFLEDHESEELYATLEGL